MFYSVSYRILKYKKKGIWRVKKVDSVNNWYWHDFSDLYRVNWMTEDFDPCVPNDMIDITYHYYGDIYWVLVDATDWIDALKIAKPLIKFQLEEYYSYYHLLVHLTNWSNRVYEKEQQIDSIRWLLNKYKKNPRDISLLLKNIEEICNIKLEK